MATEYEPEPGEIVRVKYAIEETQRDAPVVRDVLVRGYNEYGYAFYHLPADSVGWYGRALEEDWTLEPFDKEAYHMVVFGPALGTVARHMLPE